jgi:hypothetical protein
MDLRILRGAGCLALIASVGAYSRARGRRRYQLTLTIIQMTGDHLTMMRNPHSLALAREISKVLLTV